MSALWRIGWTTMTATAPALSSLALGGELADRLVSIIIGLVLVLGLIVVGPSAVAV